MDPLISIGQFTEEKQSVSETPLNSNNGAAGKLEGHDHIALEVAKVARDCKHFRKKYCFSSNAVTIDRVLIDPCAATGEVKVRIELANNLDENLYVQIRCIITENGAIAATADTGANLTALGQHRETFNLLLQNPRLWSPESPFLYNLEIEITGIGEEVYVTRSETFGIRSLIVGDDLRLYLNGHPVYLRGNTWVPGYSQLPFEPSFCEKMMLEHKRLGFNYIRHHSTVPPYDWYYSLADRIGLMISIEVGFDIEETQKIMSHFYNHPCIVFWGGVNEVHKTGTNPEVKKWYKAVKELDPYRLVYDCSGWGEFDRDTTDVLCQHFGYEFPYLWLEDLYSRYDYYLYEGSVKGTPIQELEKAIKDGTFKVDKPQIIHELQGNAQIYSDKTLLLDARMRRLWQLHGFDYADWPKYVEANQRFVATCYKINYEAARRADNQNGFELLTVADSICELDRNTNRNPSFGDLDITGICDALGEPKRWLVKDLPVLNAPHLVLIDSHGKPRTLWNDESISVSVLASCFDYAPPEKVELVWTLGDALNPIKSGVIKDLKLKYPGVGKICEIDIPLDFVDEPSCLDLNIAVRGENYRISNSWKFWIFPKEQVSAEIAGKIFSNIKWVAESLPGAIYCDFVPDAENCDLFITDRLDEPELFFLSSGGKMLLIQNHAKGGFSCIPTSYRHRMYHSWLGGHSMGTIVHQHPIFERFPNEGFGDIQFFNLLQGCNRLILDDLPGRPIPILEAVPCLENLMPRNSGYLVEMRVGEGKLMVTGLRLELAIGSETTASWMLYELAKYCAGNDFEPEYSITPENLETSLLKARNRVWVTSGPMWYLYPEDDLHIDGENWEGGHFSIPCILPADGKAKGWIKPVGDGGWGSDEWGWHGEGMAVNGYRAFYWEAKELPADLGVEWPSTVSIANIYIEFLDELSIPAENGWELQVQKSGDWIGIAPKTIKLNDVSWILELEGLETNAVRFVFSRMNPEAVKAEENGDPPFGARAGYPLPVTWLKEKAVPRVRTLQVKLAEEA